MSNPMPIYSYPGGKKIYVPQLPQNTVFKWVDPYGGNTVGGPLNWSQRLCRNQTELSDMAVFIQILMENH